MSTVAGNINIEGTKSELSVYDKMKLIDCL